MKAAPLQANFNAGELSPLMYGRPDIAKYKNGTRLCQNFLNLIQGGMTRRPGTKYVAEVKDSSKATRVVRFEFSATQAYIIEFGNLYCRFYKDHGQIVSGTPVEIATPYVEADLFQLRFTQSADTLYIAHQSYAQRKLTRSSHTSWSLTAVGFSDGPYLNLNATTTTITPSGTTGAITLLASAALFVATDVGRAVRIKAGATWGWVTITGFTSPTNVSANVGGTLAGTAATTDWRLGVWSATTGYPACVAFFEDRLFWAGTPSYPQRLDSSKSGDYENMAPSAADGTVAADNALALTLNSSDVNVIRWMIDDERGLMIGTLGGEWILRPSTTSEALSPTNAKASRATNNGCANIAPVRATKSALYVQRAGRKLRELAYVFQSDGFNSPDMTVLAEHITAGGVKELAYQREPQSVVWAVRNDGVLLGFTYDRDQDVLGWHRHVLGGSFGTGAAVVESAACIPEPNGAYDEVWLVVKRTINGSTKRYIEYMTKIRESTDALSDAFYVDAGLTYSGAPATTISGLDHLEGQTIDILADGAPHPQKAVSGGSITLDRAASKAQCGLHYDSDGQTLRIEAGSADGTAQGKTKRIHRLGMRLHDTLGGKFGPSFDKLTPIPFRTSADPMGSPPALFSGDKTINWEGDYETEGYVCWRQDQPLPFTLLDLMPQLVTQDR